MTMTLAELLADLEAQLEDGVDPETPVLTAIQPNWPLVNGLAGLAAVYAGEDRTAPCTHLLLAAGAQRDWPWGRPARPSRRHRPQPSSAPHAPQPATSQVCRSTS